MSDGLDESVPLAELLTFARSGAEGPAEVVRVVTDPGSSWVLLPVLPIPGEGGFPFRRFWRVGSGRYVEALE